jgi:hypothetical protein
LLRRILLLGAVMAAMASPALAERRAILIGVSNYQQEAIPDLRGPHNDVTLMHDVLPGLGFTDIVVLADGTKIDGALPPTRANIDAAFAHMRTAATGDQVMLFMAGHGTRQTDDDGDEADRYDEVFLPADVERAQLGGNAKDGIPNALVDDEIGAFLDDIRRNGAHAWLIMDSCFSAGGSRSPNNGTATRQVDAALLSAGDRPEAVSLEDRIDAKSADLGPRPGELVAFYAAQSYEQAKEFNFGKDGAEEFYGIFTAKLAERLRTGEENVTYQQLFEGVLDDMNDTGLTGSGKSQTPFIEGTRLDLTIGLSSGRRQYALQEGAIAAGAIQGITAGAILGVYADATDADDSPVGYVQVIDAGAILSDVRPVGEDCLAQQDGRLCRPLGADDASFFFEGGYVRLVSPSVDVVLSLSEPLLLDDDPTNAALVAKLEEAATLARDRLGTPVTLNSATYDLGVGFKGGRIWFATEDGFADGKLPSGVAWPAVNDPSPDTRELADLLQRAAKAQNLVRVAETLQGQRDLFYLPTVKVDVTQAAARSIRSPDEVAADDFYNPRSECRTVERADPAPMPKAGNVKQCDTVDVAAYANGISTRYDVNLVYIDANFGIHVNYMQLTPPGTVPASLWADTLCSECGPKDADKNIPTVFGPETILVISAEAVPGMRPFNLTELAQDGVRSATALRDTATGKANAALDTLFGFAFPQGNTRGNVGGLPDTVEVEVFRWRVLPREVAFSGLVAQPAE